MRANFLSHVDKTPRCSSPFAAEHRESSLLFVNEDAEFQHPVSTRLVLNGSI